MPEGVTDVWLVGLLEPQPLLIEALERRKDRLNIHVIIGADEADAALFDAWGRPDPARWANRQTPWPRRALCPIICKNRRTHASWWQGCANCVRFMRSPLSEAW